MSTFDPSRLAPELSTARLRLRGHRVEDYEDCAAMWGEAAVTRFIGGKPSTREQAWARLLRYIGHWTALGFGYWVIHESATGSFVGEVGFADFKRDIDPAFGDAPEIGWVLAPPAFGKGYGTEAARAAVAWMDATFGARRSVCMIDPENAASLKVAEKCGYREYARTLYGEKPTILHERRRR
jgi:RimJ/RimL family protein N-acetyltransferase